VDSTILLVDDVRLFLEMQKEFLQHTSVQIVTAKNGREALEVIKTRRPDVIFMDLEMPEMDGATCCRTIKANPTLAHIPVVMITAKGDERSEQACRAAGCDAFLTKPMSRTQFLEAAGRYVVDLERREKRLSVTLPATLRSRGAEFPCTMRNLSPGGAFLAAACSAEIDRIVELVFTLPDGSTHECRAKVVWTRPNGADSNGFGVNFILLQPAVKAALTDLLNGLNAPGPAT
jgi:CheY-like chemotaxis protein